MPSDKRDISAAFRRTSSGGTDMLSILYAREYHVLVAFSWWRVPVQVDSLSCRCPCSRGTLEVRYRSGLRHGGERGILLGAISAIASATVALGADEPRVRHEAAGNTAH
jgi:hypothetical protein